MPHSYLNSYTAKRSVFHVFPEIPNPLLKEECLALSTAVTRCDQHPYPNCNWLHKDCMVLPLTDISAQGRVTGGGLAHNNLFLKSKLDSGILLTRKKPQGAVLEQAIISALLPHSCLLLTVVADISQYSPESLSA